VALPVGVQRPDHKANHSPPTSNKVKNAVALPVGVQRPDHKANHSPPTSNKVKNA
jgi:hypothetical protein